MMRIDSGGKGGSRGRRTCLELLRQEMVVAWAREEATVAIHSSYTVVILPERRPICLRDAGSLTGAVCKHLFSEVNLENK